MYLNIFISTCLISIYLPIYLSTYLSIYLSIYLSTSLPTYPSTYLPIYLLIYEWINQSIYQSINLQISKYGSKFQLAPTCEQGPCMAILTRTSRGPACIHLEPQHQGVAFAPGHRQHSMRHMRREDDGSACLLRSIDLGRAGSVETSETPPWVKQGLAC